MKNHFFILFLFFFSLSGNAQTSFSFEKSIAEAKALSDSDEAIAALEALLQKAEQAEVQDTLALIYHTIGLKSYQTDAGKAIANTKKAIEIRASLQDTAGLTMSCFNVSRFYMLLTNNEFDAIPTFEQIVALGPDPINKNYYNSLTYLCQLEGKRGDYFKAIQYGELGISGLEAKDEITSADEVAKAQFLYTLASIYNEMEGTKNLRKSLVYFQPAIQILEQQDELYDLANCYLEIGNTYSYLNEPQSAAESYQKAFELFYSDEYYNAAVKALNNLSGEYIHLGEMAKAKAVLQQGMDIRDELYGEGYDYRKAILHNSLGEVYLNEEDHEAALTALYEAIYHLFPDLKAANNKLPSEEQMSVTTQKQDLLAFLENIAKVHIATYQEDDSKDKLKAALAAIEKSDALIDLMRFEQTAEESKLVWRNKVHDTYELALWICKELNDVEKAFYFMEKSKSILLLEGLLAADARAVIPNDLADKEKALFEATLQIKEELAESPGNVKKLNALLDTQKELDELVKDLAKAYPKYHGLKYESKVLSLADAKSNLGKDQHLTLSYFVGEENIYALAFGQSEEAFIQIPFTTALNESISGFLAQFLSAQTILNDPAPYAQYGYEVYEALLLPIFDQIEQKDIKSLDLILDGKLQYIPFEALLTTSGKEKSGIANLPYLIHDYVIGYAYSATILQKQISTPIHPSAQILGVAPFANTDNQFGALAYSEEELAMIESAINGIYSLDASASLASFLAQAESFPILHLSTHASAQSDGGFPRIFFNEKSLLLPDLYTLELPADLVVLSACETGLGEVEVGEGVMSLARGFTYAGAQSLISSLWKVNDRSTAILFQSFYQNLLRGKSKTTALHQSKLDYLMDNERPAFQKSPYYWAGFVHIGGDQVLELDAKKSLLWIWIGVGVGFLLAIGILRYVVFK